MFRHAYAIFSLIEWQMIRVTYHLSFIFIIYLLFIYIYHLLYYLFIFIIYCIILYYNYIILIILYYHLSFIIYIWQQNVCAFASLCESPHVHHICWINCNNIQWGGGNMNILSFSLTCAVLTSSEEVKAAYHC